MPVAGYVTEVTEVLRLGTARASRHAYGCTEYRLRIRLRSNTGQFPDILTPAD